jgi:hypothetical protein
MNFNFIFHGLGAPPPRFWLIFLIKSNVQHLVYRPHMGTIEYTGKGLKNKNKINFLLSLVLEYYVEEDLSAIRRSNLKVLLRD